MTALQQAVRAIGLMSGTSLDGIDAAGLITDGERILEHGPALTLPYSPAMRAELRALLDRAPSLAADDPALAATTERLTLLHAQAVRALDWPAELVGFHGQTILHDPAHQRSWQIGDPGLLARSLGLAVAFGFRQADVAAGGQGAPLVPVYHQAICAGLDAGGPIAVLNIGGVANLTYIDGPTLLACDTGPGNALIDDLCAARTGVPMDRGGALALRGQVQGAVLHQLLTHPYFAQSLPKSLDRQQFALALAALEGLSLEDAAATLAAFTAAAVAATRLPRPPARLLVCGGGRHNGAIMRELAARMPATRVEGIEAIGIDGDSLEAACFAFLAVRVRRRLPLSFPGTTGVPAPLPGGEMFHP